MHDGIMLASGEGRTVQLQGLGVRFLVSGVHTGGRFALLKHPLEPRALGSPLHTHENEEEISYVPEGEIGVQVGEQVRVASPGAVVFKPRGIPHAFWNAGDTPARLLEIITQAGFEAAAQLFAGAASPIRRARQRCSSSTICTWI